MVLKLMILTENRKTRENHLSRFCLLFTKSPTYSPTRWWFYFDKHSDQNISLSDSEYLIISMTRLKYHWQPNAAFPISFPLWHSAGDWAGVSWQAMFCIASHKNIAASTVILSPAISRILIEDIWTIPNTDSIKNFYATMAAVFVYLTSQDLPLSHNFPCLMLLMHNSMPSIWLCS